MSEFDYDRLIQVRASVIEDGERRIKELEAELAKAKARIEWFTKSTIYGVIADLPFDPETNEKLSAENAKLEAELANIKCEVASIADLANTYCREHHLPEVSDPKQAIERLAWKCVAAEQENARLRECLKRLEWSAGDLVDNVCPACDGAEIAGHCDDCWLAAELKEK